MQSVLDTVRKNKRSNQYPNDQKLSILKLSPNYGDIIVKTLLRTPDELVEKYPRVNLFCSKTIRDNQKLRIAVCYLECEVLLIVFIHQAVNYERKK